MGILRAQTGAVGCIVLLWFTTYLHTIAEAWIYTCTETNQPPHYIAACTATLSRDNPSLEDRAS